MRADIILFLKYQAGLFKVKIAAMMLVVLLCLVLVPVSLEADDQDYLIFEVQTEQAVSYYQAVGTISPRHEPAISSRIQAEVLEVLVNSGDEVKPGELMIRLDDREYKSRLEQAVEQFQAARAAVKRAEHESAKARAHMEEVSQDYERYKNLHSGDIISRQEYEKAASAYYQATADYEQSLMAIQEADYNRVAAQEKAAELKILLGYTEIRAPGRGEVVQRLIHPGDMASPGKVLIELQSRHLLRMQAQIPERLVSRVDIGEEYEIRIDSLQKNLKAKVAEIVPQADTSARSFLVKLDIETGQRDIYPGMFARMLVPLAHEDVILVPASALHYTGQLQTVNVLENGQADIRHVRVGRKFQEYIEILSGLNAGEKVILKKDGSP
ncbi:MAG: efflux RND transporter periplasmic adaptor subunit [Desulfonatronovibrio sp.]